MECAWISIVKFQDFADDFQLGEFIKEKMSKSWVVIIQGYSYQKVPFGSDNFWRLLKIPRDYKLVVLGIYISLIVDNKLIYI